MRPGLGVAVERAGLEGARVRAALHHRPQPREIERAERSFRHPGQLKERDIGGAERLGGMLQRLRGPDVRVGAVHQHDAPEPRGVAGRDPPADHRAPIVPDQVKAVGPVRVGERHHVGGECVELVGGHLGRRVARVIAVHVGDGDVISGLRQRRDLVPPRPPELGESVQQYEQRVALSPGLDDMAAEAVHPAAALAPAGFEEVGCRRDLHMLRPLSSGSFSPRAAARP